MNRRAFVGSLATAATALAWRAHPRAHRVDKPNVVIHFVGMFGFIRRSDGSLIAATPGPSSMSHVEHASFVMARKGSAAASVFALSPYPGVVPAAFDPRLQNGTDFVFACTRNMALEVSRAPHATVVDVPGELAQMRRISPGKNVRGDVMKWAEMTFALQDGQLINETVHPDADKRWQFGTHTQLLTDAVRYESSNANLRVLRGTEVRTIHPTTAEPLEFWVVSAPRVTAGGRASDPTKLTHGAALFEFLVDAEPIIGVCPEARGGAVRESNVPCNEPRMASTGGVAMPPTPFWPEFCYMAYFETR